MRPGSRHKPVAIVVDGLAEYQQRVVRGVDSVLSARGVASVVVVRHLHEGDASDSIFDLVRPEAVRGVVATTVTEQTARAYFGPFLEHENPPLVAIGTYLPGVPGVRADNTAVMGDLVSHLLAHRPGVVRPVVVRGRPGNPDSDDRERAALAAFAAAGIEVPAEHVLTGHFERSEAHRAVCALLGQVPDVDAVVALNDLMAYGVLDALEDAHRRVPDVAVTGFDDEPPSRSTRPPLTTVDQCQVDQGVRAAQLLLARIESDTSSPHVVVPARVVVRRSCGEPPLSGLARVRSAHPAAAPSSALSSAPSSARSSARPAKGSSSAGAPAGKGSPDAARPAREHPAAARAAVRAGVARGPQTDPEVAAVGTDLEEALAALGAPPVGLPPDWVRQWAELALAAVEPDGDPGPWLTHGLQPLWTTAEAGGDMTWWAQAAATLLETLLVHRSTHQAALRAALLHGELSSRIAEAEHEVWLDSRRRELAALDHALAVNEELRTVETLEDLTRTVVHNLPGLGIDRFYLSLFAGEAGAPTASARLVVAYGDRRVDESATGVVFPSAQLLPPQLGDALAGGVLVLQPLRVGRAQHGFVLYDQPFSHAQAGDGLRRGLAACLDGLTHRRELALARDALSDVVLARTRRLTVEVLARSTGSTASGLSADPLTGLADAAGLQSALSALWARLDREGRPVAVLVVDVDDFTAFNEAAGTEQGDSALRRLSGVLARAAQRPGDVVARVAGQRFVLVLPDTGEAGAAEVARRLHRFVHDAAIAWPGEPVRYLTVSTGIAARVPDLAVEPAELVEAAEHAVYIAKELGRDRWAVAGAERAGWLLEAAPEVFVPQPREPGSEALSV